MMKLRLRNTAGADMVFQVTLGSGVSGITFLL